MLYFRDEYLNISNNNNNNANSNINSNTTTTNTTISSNAPTNTCPQWPRRLVLLYDSEYAAKSVTGEYNGKKNSMLIHTLRSILQSIPNDNKINIDTNNSNTTIITKNNNNSNNNNSTTTNTTNSKQYSALCEGEGTQQSLVQRCRGFTCKHGMFRSNLCSWTI